MTHFNDTYMLLKWATESIQGPEKPLLRSSSEIRPPQPLVAFSFATHGVVGRRDREKTVQVVVATN